MTRSKTARTAADGRRDRENTYGSTYLGRHPGWHMEDSPHKAEIVLEIIQRQRLNPNTICDIGCGAGEVLRLLHRHYAGAVECCGYETSMEAYRLCKSREKPGLAFKCQDSFADDTHFDIVLALDVIEHVEDCMGFSRSLKAKGEYKILRIPLDANAFALVCNGWMRNRELLGHLHYFTKDTALAALSETGHEVLDWFYSPNLPPSRNNRPRFGALRLALGKLIRKLASLVLGQDLSVRLLGGQSLMVITK